MKKLYAFITAALLAGSVSAQCTADASLLHPTEADIFPSAAHLPHLIVDSAYNQTIQARIPTEMSMNFLGFVQVDVRIDSIRLDSIEGLPAGISWVKSPDVLYGGQIGCVQFTGTAADASGEYALNPIGQIWAHLSVPVLGIDVDTFSYGSIDRVPPFNNYYLVVDDLSSTLSLSNEVDNLCFGETNTGTIEIFAGGGTPTEPYTYNWSNGSKSYLLTDLAPGTYDVTVTSGTETITATYEVNQQPSAISLTVTTNAGSNGADGEAYVTATGGVPPYTFEWNNGAGTDDTATGLAPGNYRVNVTDELGCTETQTVTIQDLANSISVLNSNTTINIYPNPATDVLNIQIDAQQQLNAIVQVLDMTGRALYTAPVGATGRYNHTVNTSAYSTGLYTLQLTSGNQSIRQKFVITH